MDAVKKPFLAAVSGVKNSGKTTFLEKLLPELSARGYRVAVIKHDGHEFQGDVPGTDTYRMSEAGAYGTCIFSKNKWMIRKNEPDRDVETLAGFFPEADMILLEGMKDSPYPKIEIVRKGNSEESVCCPDTLIALVTDTGLQIKNVPSVGLEEIKICADLLEFHMNL